LTPEPGSGHRATLQGTTWAVVALLAFSAFALALAVIHPGVDTGPTSSAQATVAAPGGPGVATQPPGGITAEQAIDIATDQRGLRGRDGFSASAVSMLDPASQLWVWHVSWKFAGGPTSSEGCDDVTVDYLTGAVLSRTCWVS
jgi:hypothetical protein